jgi:hypothetical protein
MKFLPIILTLAAATVLTGCDEATVLVGSSRPAYYGGTVWVGPGYYSGTYYRSEDIYYDAHPSYRHHGGDYVRNDTRNTVVQNNTVNQVNVNRRVVNKKVYHNAPARVVNNQTKNVSRPHNQVVVEKKNNKKKKKDRNDNN